MPSARLYPIAGGLALQSDYHAELVQAIKDLPYADRRWDKSQRAWIIAPEHADFVVRQVDLHLGIQLEVPGAAPASTIPEIRMVRLEYLGRCKQRGAGATASGYADGGWTLVFPEQVLRDWFADGEPTQPAEQRTLYQVLGLRADADEQAIKKAYRQLARQWHPDVCAEPDASEQFQRIQRAYEVLRENRTRRKYDAGLALEEHARGQRSNVRRYQPVFETEYRAPLRCGLVLVEGQSRVGQFIGSKIHKWEDIVDAQGRTMVSSWPLGAQTFKVEWV